MSSSIPLKILISVEYVAVVIGPRERASESKVPSKHLGGLSMTKT